MRSWPQLDFVKAAMPEFAVALTDMAEELAPAVFLAIEPHVFNDANERALVAYPLGLDASANEICETLGHGSDSPRPTRHVFRAAHGATNGVVFIAAEFDVAGTSALLSSVDVERHAAKSVAAEQADHSAQKAAQDDEAVIHLCLAAEVGIEQKPAANESQAEDFVASERAVEVGGDGFHLCGPLAFELLVNAVALGKDGAGADANYGRVVSQAGEKELCVLPFISAVTVPMVGDRFTRLDPDFLWDGAIRYAFVAHRVAP